MGWMKDGGISQTGGGGGRGAHTRLLPEVRRLDVGRRNSKDRVFCINAGGNGDGRRYQTGACSSHHDGGRLLARGQGGHCIHNIPAHHNTPRQ